MSDQSDEIDDAIVANATGPARVIVAGQEVDAKPVSELIAAANHLERKAVIAAGRGGFMQIPIIPGGGGGT